MAVFMAAFVGGLHFIWRFLWQFLWAACILYVGLHFVGGAAYTLY